MTADESVQRTDGATAGVAGALWALALALVAAALAWGRLSPVQRGTMWAEDAAVFSRRALDSAEAPFGVLTGYGGYTHLLPQSIANALWALVPPEHMALAFTAAACGVAGAVAAGVFVLTRPWGLPPALRATLGLIVVVSPGAATEVLGNLANIHWLLLYAAPFLFLFRPRTWTGSAVMGLVALVVVTTEVQAFLFAPLLLAAPRTRRLLPAAAAVVAGICVQVAAYATTRQPRATDPRDVVAIVRTYFFEVPLIGTVGSSGAAAEVVVRSGAVAALVAIVPFIAAAIIAARGPRSRIFVVSLLLASSGILWAAGFGLNYSAGFDFLGLPAEELREDARTLRYAVVPIMFLWACVVLAAARLRRPLSLALVAVCITAFVVGYHVDDRSDRAAGPLWEDSWHSSRAVCAADADDPSDYVEAAPARWGVELDCATLIEGPGS